MKNLIYLLSVALIVFTGCESKKYYEPEFITEGLELEGYEINDDVVDYTLEGVTLDDDTFLSKNTEVETKLKEGFKFLNDDGETILSADLSNNFLIQSKNKEDRLLTFDSNVLSATKHKNLIALLLTDNAAALYDLEKEKVVFKEYLNTSLVNDVKIPSPVFLDTLVLYPTLDGKVLIVDGTSNKIYKTINIDPKSEINNITFMETVGNSLVAATPNKIFTFANGRVNVKSLDVRYVAVNNNDIYAATLDGRIVKYDLKLIERKSKKFKFAKFVALGYGKSGLYALESQGYMVKMDNDLENLEIYEFDFDNEQKVITIGNKLYFENIYTILK
jgi:hypothetical protein